MKRALITGIEGFTGRHLAQALACAGYAVSGLSHRPSGELSWPVHACDLLDRGALSGVVSLVRPDVVIHLAGIAFVAHSDPAAIYQTNVVGTRNLLDALAASGSQASAVLLASSANVYGNAQVQPLVEEQALAPANDYAVSKLAMEYVAKLWGDKLPITIVRPFNYTGIGQPLNFLLPKIVKHFADRAPVLELGNLDVIRDFSDVRNVVDVYSRLLGADVAGQTFNVCSGTGYSLRDILAIMRDLTGHWPEITTNPSFVRGSEVHKLICSPARLQRAVGPISWIHIRETLAWMLEASN